MDTNNENRSAAGPADSTPVIAVIDDEQKWLKVYQRMFRNSRYRVDTFTDPQRFLDTIMHSPERYAGIICDIQMPQLNGHQVFEAVKNNPATRDIPFLIVSGVLTRERNLNRLQGTVFVSKLDDDLRARIFEELIQVIENWPKMKKLLQDQGVESDRIAFFRQFFINYQTFFNEILHYINRMEQACVDEDSTAIAEITRQCTEFMNNLHDQCMRIIAVIQEGPAPSDFARKLCERARSSLNMIQNFQLVLAEETASNEEFRIFLQDCRDNLEKIIIGTEDGYNLRTE